MEHLKITNITPFCVFCGLNHTDGMIGPGLGHVPHSSDGVLLWVILLNPVMIVRDVETPCTVYTVATYNL